MAKKKVHYLESSEIGISIEDYDFIFSDFDPRPFSEKALSDDFLSEIRRASLDKPLGEIHIKFLIPSKKRSYSTEEIIKKRLKSHFRKHEIRTKKDYKNKILEGALFVFFGTVMMFFTSLLTYYLSGKSFITSFFTIILEPAGWFLFWEGLNLVIFRSKELRPNFEFYEKMTNAKISFQNH